MTTQEPENVEFQHGLSISCASLGDLALRAGGFGEAASYYERAETIAKAVLVKNPGDAELAALAARAGQFAQSAKIWQNPILRPVGFALRAIGWIVRTLGQLRSRRSHRP